MPGKGHAGGAVNFDVLLEHYCDAFPQPEPSKEADREALAATRKEFRDMLETFESVEGTIKSQCWCARVGAGAVLTSKPRGSRVRQRLSGDEVRYFSGGNPVEVEEDLPLARLMSKADREAQRVEDLLSNPMRANALTQLFAVRATAIEGFEAIAKGNLKDERAAAARKVTELQVRTDLASAIAYAEDAIRRRSQLLYLGGMAIGVLALVVVSAALMLFFAGQGPLYAGTELVPTALILGGLGAVVSVLQRMTRGELRTSLDNGQVACVLLGAFRPLIGAVLAFAIALLILGTILPIDLPDNTAQGVFFIAGIAFLAGFSERYAQEMIGSARSGSIASVEAVASVSASTDDGVAEPAEDSAVEKVVVVASAASDPKPANGL